MKKDAALNVVLLLLAGATVGGYVMGRLCERRHAPLPVVRTDTVVVVRRDTVTVEKPVPVSQTVVRKDTVFFWISDTVRVPVPVEITERTYKGDDYMATVSGYHPKLETISVFPKTVTVYTKETVEKPVPYRCTVSPFAGVDIGHETFAARVGVLADYSPKKTGWRAFLGGGYEVRDDVMNRGWFATGGISFQIHP